ncbi:hypothetical protein ACE1SV_61950 [Streptomyces sp. E-15]
MFVQPWDAALDDAERRAWIADGHDFGQLCVNGLPGRPPAVVTTHFTADGDRLLIHLARPHPVWQAVEHDANVTFTVIGDYAFIPGPWRAKPGTPPTDGVPTSYYAAVRFTCRAAIVDDPEAKAELLRRRLARFQPDGDHAPVAHRTDVAGRLTSRGQALDVPTARGQLRRLDRVGPWQP